MLATWWAGIWFLGCLATTSARSKTNNKTKPASIRADVGRFSIPIKDDRIGDWKLNQTLQNHLADLLDDALDLWIEEEVVSPISIEAKYLTQNATTELTGPNEFDLYAQNLLNLANQSLQADAAFLRTHGYEEACFGPNAYLNFNNSGNTLMNPLFQRCFTDDDLLNFYDVDPSWLVPGNESAISLFMNQTFFDLYSEYVQAVYNTSVLTQFYNFGALMGIGWTVECSDAINTVLESKDEWAKAGSAAATTLMALLPTFLAFGNLFVLLTPVFSSFADYLLSFVPRSSEVFATSGLVGLGSSLFTFGLPVQSVS